MFSNDFALEKKLKLKEKEKQTKSNETKTGFEIKDDDLLNTFG